MNPETAHRKSHMTYGAFALGALSLFAIAPVNAASDIIVSRPNSMSSNMASNIYLGVGLGNANYDEVNDSSAAFSLFGGIHINEVLAIDLGWTDLGEATQGTSKAEVSVLQVGLLGKMPVNTDLALFAKVGLARWTYDSSTPTDSGSDDDIDAYFGVGVDYHINGRSTMRFDATFYSLKPTISNVNLPTENISLFSIGYLFKL